LRCMPFERHVFLRKHHSKPKIIADLYILRRMG
jgi:hypothetical protein